MIQGSLRAVIRLLLILGICGFIQVEKLGAKEREVPSALRAQIDAAIEKVKPALVRIRVVSTEFSEGREDKRTDARPRHRDAWMDAAQEINKCPLLASKR